jgi:Phosphoribosyl transferase (PRTase)
MQTETYQELSRENLWQQPVYAQFLDEIDPFEEIDRFRPLDQAYDGNPIFWQCPSPEPKLPNEFWQQVHSNLVHRDIQIAASHLAGAIANWENDPNQLLFVAILRAGVPIADWLCRLLPGSVAVSISLFTGLGIDQVALMDLRLTYPNRKLIFVDGWTGRGGVAREIAKLGLGPLAVLIDPWRVATFSGSFNDLFCPSACFTGVTTLGFSRTFYTDERSWFSAYLLPSKYTRPDLVRAWQNACPTEVLDPLPHQAIMRISTNLRVHSNEVCRALINADPEILYFTDDESYAKEHYPLILELAELRSINILYNCEYIEQYETHVACSFKSK